MMKRVLAATALATLLAAPAFAQQPAGNSNMANQSSASVPAQAGFVQNQSRNEWRGSKLIGTSVYGPDNKSIGSIDDVIIASNGQIKAAVIGVGQKDVAVPFDQLHVSRKADSSSIEKITVSYTKDELKNAPKFAYYQASGSSSTTGSGLNGLSKGSMSTTPAKPMGAPK